MESKEQFYRKEMALIKKLPLSQELIKVDANANAFYHCLLRGDDPYTVIDQMLLHYTKIKNEAYEIMKELHNLKNELTYLKRHVKK